MRSFDEEAASIAGLEDGFDAKALWSLKLQRALVHMDCPRQAAKVQLFVTAFAA